MLCPNKIKFCIFQSGNYDGTFDAIASEHKNNSYELKKPIQPFKIGTGNGKTFKNWMFI